VVSVSGRGAVLVDSFVEALINTVSTLYDHNLRPFSFTFRETTLNRALGTEPEWPGDAPEALRGSSRIGYGGFWLRFSVGSTEPMKSPLRLSEGL
jgi:hypothetical protein